MDQADAKRSLSLRLKCFIIGYLNLIASFVDIGCHILIVGYVTSGFQCDVDRLSLQSIYIPWLEPILLIINLGTHGFYPFPLILRTSFDLDLVPLRGDCYPGMLHVSIIDVLNFFINVIWMKFVISYVIAVHKKNPEPMRMFFGMSLVKLALQVMYFGHQQWMIEFQGKLSAEGYWFIKVMDICIAAFFLMIIYKYTACVQRELAHATPEQPPSYNECLIISQNKKPADTAIIDVTMASAGAIPVDSVKA